MGDVTGWILYDDGCGFCRRWVPFWEGTLKRRGFEIATLQSPWVQEKLAAIQGDPVDDLRLLLANGEVISGADAYRYAMRRIWWAYPVFLVSKLPVFGALFDVSYRWFARHRHQVSAACGLPGASDRE